MRLALRVLASAGSGAEVGAGLDVSGLSDYTEAVVPDRYAEDAGLDRPIDSRLGLCEQPGLRRTGVHLGDDPTQDEDGVGAGRLNRLPNRRQH